jgi:hypothetical protein
VLRIAIDLLSAIFYFDLGQLGQRNPFAGSGQQTNIFNRFLGISIRLLVANHQVVARLALQHLADRAPAHCSLNGILHVSHIDTEARSGCPVDHVVQVELADYPEDSQVLDASDLAHNGFDLVALLLQQLQIIPVELDRQFAFDSADCLLHVVRDGLGKVPDHPRHLLQFAIHGANQLVFVLMEGGPPIASDGTRTQKIPLTLVVM